MWMQLFIFFSSFMVLYLDRGGEEVLDQVFLLSKVPLQRFTLDYCHGDACLTREEPERQWLRIFTMELKNIYIYFMFTYW